MKGHMLRGYGKIEGGNRFWKETRKLVSSRHGKLASKAETEKRRDIKCLTFYY